MLIFNQKKKRVKTNGVKLPYLEMAEMRLDGFKGLGRDAADFPLRDLSEKDLENLEIILEADIAVVVFIRRFCRRRVMRGLSNPRVRVLRMKNCLVTESF